MSDVTYSQLEELVRQLPESKLPQAYQLIQRLSAEGIGISPQQDFLKLPLEIPRQRLLAEAQGMVAYYEKTAEERQEWQSGDFQDDY